jgi:RNA polymerase sigma-70 factor (ECF subfamily)
VDGLPDAELVTQCLAGRTELYRSLVRRHQTRVFNFLVRLLRQRELAEDVAQEAFFTAYAKLDTCKDPALFYVWLMRIARNRAFNVLRRGRLDVVPLTPASGDTIEVPDERSIGEGSAEGQLEAREVAAELEKRVMGLPPKYRATVLLRHTEGRSYQEIAEILEIPMGTVKFRLHRAYKLLKERLGKR